MAKTKRTGSAKATKPKPKAKTTPKPKVAPKVSPKVATKVATKAATKAKATMKPTAKPTTTAVTKAAAPSGGATMFDDLVWGTPIETIAAGLGVRAPKGASTLAARRTIGGVAFHVTYQFQSGGLVRILLSGVRRYGEDEDGTDDQSAALEWVETHAGAPTERSAGSAKWLLPTVKIWSYCDESLGLYFEQPPTS